MAVTYLPVMLSINHPHPELEQWVVDRFEALNNRRVFVVRAADLPAEALSGHATYAKLWLWDAVPKTTERILYFDYDVVFVRPLPALPDVPFAACPDAQRYVEQRLEEHVLFQESGNYFNAGLFLAHRSTRPVFEQARAFRETQVVKQTPPYDQTTLNLLMQSAVGVTWLPHAYNTVMLEAEPAQGAAAIAVHLCGLSRNTRWVVMNTLRTVLGLSRPV